MISPGYPVEMSFFTRALARVGATVIGVGDQPRDALPPAAREGLAHYERVPLSDKSAVLSALSGLGRYARFELVECLWEPYMLLAAHLRGGLRVVRHDGRPDRALPRQGEDEAADRRGRDPHAEAREHDHRVGRLGCGRVDRIPSHRQTHRRWAPRTPTGWSAAELNDVLPMLRHIPEISVEEFVDGEEFTYDTVCAGGRLLFEHMLWYRPRPLQMRLHEWISPSCILASRPVGAAPSSRPPDGSEGADGARLRVGFHAHGVVPNGRRRGGLR